MRVVRTVVEEPGRAFGLGCSFAVAEEPVRIVGLGCSAAACFEDSHVEHIDLSDEYDRLPLLAWAYLEEVDYLGSFVGWDRSMTC